MATPSNIPQKTKPRRSFSVPVFIKYTIALLEWLHWRLALAFALRLFFKPIPFPVPKREHPIRQRASRYELAVGEHIAQIFEWGSGPKKILMMHGWSGRASQFFQIIEALVEANYHVYSVEAPAHGESAGKRANMIQFVEALTILGEAEAPFHAAIGHSIGGTALFNALSRSPGLFDRLIVIGTPASIRNVVYDFTATLDVSDRVAKGIIKSIQKTFSMDIRDVSTDHLARQLNPPGLIIHDEGDLDVGIGNARELAAAWKSAELWQTAGLGHRRVLSDPAVIDKVMNFIKS